MMSSLSFRAAIAVAALAVTGAAQSQTAAPAPAAPPAAPQAAAPTAPQAAAPAAPQAAAPKAPQPDSQLMTPASPPPAAKAASGTEAPAAQGATGDQRPKRNRGGGGSGNKSNFMPANPDATPILPGQGPKSRASGTDPSQPSGAGPKSGAQAGGAQGTGAQGGGKGSGKKKGGNRPIGMGRAFQDLQTKEEFTAYSAKAKAVKTTSECKALIESTKKELEPRAKAENKTIAVNATEICDKAKARGRLKD